MPVFSLPQRVSLQTSHGLQVLINLPAAMNVIRMIKLFGWEPKVAAQLSEKREEELELIKKNKLLDLVNNNLKYVVCANALY